MCVVKYLPPANEVCQGYVFTGVCLSTWGACMVALGGHAWLLQGACVVALGGSMHGCSRGRGCPRGHAWLLWGVCGCLGGMRGCSWGACMVAPGGSMHGCSRGRGVCMVAPGGACVGYDEIRSMSGRYASYWKAFLFYGGLEFSFKMAKMQYNNVSASMADYGSRHFCPGFPE